MVNKAELLDVLKDIRDFIANQDMEVNFGSGVAGENAKPRDLPGDWVDKRNPLSGGTSGSRTDWGSRDVDPRGEHVAESGKDHGMHKDDEDYVGDEEDNIDDDYVDDEVEKMKMYKQEEDDEELLDEHIEDDDMEIKSLLKGIRDALVATNVRKSAADNQAVVDAINGLRKDMDKAVGTSVRNTLRKQGFVSAKSDMISRISEAKPLGMGNDLTPDKFDKSVENENEFVEQVKKLAGKPSNDFKGTFKKLNQMRYNGDDALGLKIIQYDR